VSLTPPTTDLKVENLGEVESFYEKALTLGSLAQIELIDEKYQSVENLVTESL
jgi:hypothetical protein